MSPNASAIHHPLEALQPPPASRDVEYAVLALTLIAFIYGVTSWCLIKKFRNFKNFVYINTIISSVFRLTIVSIIIPNIKVLVSGDTQILVTCAFLARYTFCLVQNCWLLVICCIFYLEIVKVFDGGIRRRYLKSSLFAWGMPLATTTIATFVLPVLLEIKEGTMEPELRIKIYIYFTIALRISPVFINLIVYIVVVCYLFFANPVKSLPGNNWRRFYIATLLFVFSDVIILSAFFWHVALHLPVSLQTVLINFQTIVIDLFLPLFKCNRELWTEYFARRLDRHVK